MSVRASCLLSLLAAVIFLIQGCGFHLRGTLGETATLPAAISPILIQGADRGEGLRTKLEAALRAAAATVTDHRDQALSLLRISQRRSDRRVVALDSNGKVVEYELNEALSFELLDKGGDSLIPEQRIAVSQSLLSADVLVLGKQQEEAALRQTMRQRLVDQMLRRLAVQLNR